MKNIFKSFFFSKNKFQPPYFWVSVLTLLVVIMVIMRLFQKGDFDNTLILGVLGLVVGWCAVYNTRKIK